MRGVPVAAAWPLALLLGCGDADETPGWALVFDDLPGSVLSCGAAGPGDVAFVGTHGLFLHFDGERFRRIETGVPQWLWWTWSCGEDVWLVGEDGVVLRWDGRTLEPVESGTTATLFGVWGASCDDVWAVGGSPLGGGENDLLLRSDGGAFAPVALPDRRGVPLFKVWGSSASDVFVVGDAATIWHYDGAWARQAAGPCSNRLFTAYGSGPDDVFAVGGTCAIHYDGAAWGAIDGLDLAGRLPNGVYVAADRGAVIVGFGALKARRAPDGRWLDESDAEPYGVDFHAACGDGQGGFFAVGGNFLVASSPQRGVIAHYGAPHPPSRLE